MTTPSPPESAHRRERSRADRSQAVPAGGSLRGGAARLACAFSLLLSTSVAAVEPSDVDKETARELVFAGDRAYREGDFAQALARYSTAYRLVQVPSVGIEVARAQVALGQLRAAYRSAREVVELPRSSDEKPVLVQARADAAALARDLHDRIPSLQLNVTPPLVAARVEVDGVVVPSEARRSGQPLDPGQHRVSVRSPGFRSAEIALQLAEREKRLLDVKLEPEQRSVAYPTPASDVASADLLTSDAGKAPDAGKTVAYVLLGAGALGGVVAGVAGIVAYSKVPQCPEERCSRQLEDDLASSRRAGNIANLAFVAGGVSAVAGLAVWLSLPSDTEPESAALRIDGDAHGVALELMGSF